MIYESRNGVTEVIFQVLQIRCPSPPTQDYPCSDGRWCRRQSDCLIQSSYYENCFHPCPSWRSDYLLALPAYPAALGKPDHSHLTWAAIITNTSAKPIQPIGSGRTCDSPEIRRTATKDAMAVSSHYQLMNDLLTDIDNPLEFTTSLADKR